MQCHQCGGNAMFYASPEQLIPLCLDCYGKLQALNARKLDLLGRALNYVSAEMESRAGFPNSGARYQPAPAPILVSGGVLNHIRISDSNIGVVNTGTITSIDNAIGLMQNAGDAKVAEALKDLTTALANATGITKDQRDSAIELISGVSAEAAAPPQKRRGAVARALVLDLAQLLSGIASTAQLWAHYGPVIKAFFGVP